MVKAVVLFVSGSLYFMFKLIIIFDRFGVKKLVIVVAISRHRFIIRVTLGNLHIFKKDI